MRSKILPLALVVALGTGSAAIAAATVTTGVIKSVDTKTHSVTLEDGMVYMLPKSHDAKKLKAGEKVEISWEKKGDAMEASSVKMLK